LHVKSKERSRQERSKNKFKGHFSLREKTGCPFQSAVALAPLVAARLGGKPPTLPGHHLPNPKNLGEAKNKLVGDLCIVGTDGVSGRGQVAPL